MTVDQAAETAAPSREVTEQAIREQTRREIADALQHYGIGPVMRREDVVRIARGYGQKDTP